MSGGNGLGIPTGVIFDYAGDTAPAGWLICDGRAVSRSQYERLFQVIGTRFGSGDGSTTFNLPGQQGVFRRGHQRETSKTFATTDVNTSTETITITNHEIPFTGYRVRVSSTTTLPAGLLANTDYFAIRVDANSIRLASTRANALAGTAIDLTSTGSGTHTLTPWQDPDASTRQAQTVGGGIGVGGFQMDAMQGHKHTLPVFNISYLGAGGNANVDNGTPQSNQQPLAGSMFPTTDGTNGTPRTSFETRPQNTSFNWIIKV